MKIIGKLLLLACLAIGIFTPPPASAAIVFQTTFNCPADWTGSMGLSDAVVCANGDFILGYLNGAAPQHPNGDEINATANNAAGGGGKGFRNWLAPIRNTGGGSIHLLGFTPQSEMWIRFYQRFQAGFTWSVGPNIKSLYVNSSAWQAPGTFYFGWHEGVVGGHVEVDTTNRAWALASGGAGVGNMHSDTATWASMNGSSVGDGLWHCYEIHVKMNTSSGSSDGIYEFWLDGVKVYTATNVHFANANGATWSEIGISVNADTPAQASGNDQSVDYDDIVISNSGYIGPLVAGDVTPPSLSAANGGTSNAAGTTGAHVTTANDANGTLYWTTYASGSPTPTAAQVEAHTGTGAQGSTAYGSVSVTATGSQTISNITGLSSATSYLVYFVHRDAAGNLSTAVSASFTTSVVDTTPPGLSSANIGTPTAYGSTAPTVTTSEGNGTLYWATYVDGSLPLNTEVKGWTGTGAQVPSGSHGSLPVSATGVQTVTDLTGLSPTTNYDLFFVHEDAAGNLSATIKADLTTLTPSAQVVFFTETFEDNNFSARGWYDIVGGVGAGDPLIVDSSTHAPTGTASGKFHFALAGTVPTAGYPGRHVFTPSDTVYMSWWMKLGSSGTTWQGSGQNYHPHILRLYTDVDSEFISPNRNSLSFNIDVNVFKVDIHGADFQRIFDNGSTQPHDGPSPSLMGTSSPHAVMGGNGTQTTGISDWYLDGGNANDTYWRTAANVFSNNTWHHCEAYIAMNSFSGTTPLANGIFKYWVDGVLVMNETALELRTAQYLTQKWNQFAILPYIGDGSPIAQDLWLDNLTVADQPTAATVRLPISIH